jgi:hypothetical protein
MRSQSSLPFICEEEGWHSLDYHKLFLYNTVIVQYYTEKVRHAYKFPQVYRPAPRGAVHIRQLNCYLSDSKLRQTWFIINIIINNRSSNKNNKNTLRYFHRTVTILWSVTVDGVLDWWLDLLYTLIQSVTILYSSLLHTHTPMFTCTSLLPLLGTGFQRRTFPFLWVPGLSPASVTIF